MRSWCVESQRVGWGRAGRIEHVQRHIALRHLCWLSSGKVEHAVEARGVGRSTRPASTIRDIGVAVTRQTVYLKSGVRLPYVPPSINRDAKQVTMRMGLRNVCGIGGYAETESLA